MTPRDALIELCHGFSGVAGVAVEHLASGERLLVNADEQFPTASAIKPFVLFALLQAASRGSLALAERITLRADYRTLGSGVLLHLDAGLSPTLGDLGTLMMMVSDNTATNLLIERLGVGAVNEAIAGAGLAHTLLGGPIDFQRLAHDKLALGVSTPADLACFFARLRRGELLDASHTEKMWSVLRIQKYIEPLRRELPADPYAREFGEPEPVWVASKTGSLSGVRCEAGLIHAPRGEWSIAVMTKNGTDSRVTSDNHGWLLVSRASRIVYDAWG